MKALRTLFIFFFSLGAWACQAQANLMEFLNTSYRQDVSLTSLNHLEKMISSIEISKKSENEKLYIVFQKLHRTYLKKYVPYSSFNEMFNTGSFDCLTGTGLLSYVLDRLAYQHEIIETNYHIFIMVRIGDEKILLESTDRFGGFVTDQSLIAERTSGYQQNLLTSSKSGSFQYRYSFQLYQVINAQQVTGLLFFNQAVKAFNNREWARSSICLKKAMNYYPSERCEELNNLLTRTLMSAQIDETSRQECLALLQNFTSANSTSMAAR